MIQCRRAPNRLSSGSKWKIARWIQYSERLQNMYPATSSPAIANAPTRPIESAKSTEIAGRKMITGTAGCTRESRSRKFDSNIRGEARRTSGRGASIVAPDRSAVPCRCQRDKAQRGDADHRDRLLIYG